MSLYSRHILPHLIRKACSSATITRERAEIVPAAEGVVLEIGAGGGLNLPHYDRDRVARVLGLDISPELLRTATETARATGLKFEPLLMDAAEIPLERHAVDTVLVTFSLCSIGDLDSALSEMRRVLKPGGRFLFCEHGAAPDPGVRRVQDALTPVWKRVGGGCHLNRDAPERIRAAGFRIETLEQAYLPDTWRFVGYVSRGVARPG